MPPPTDQISRSASPAAPTRIPGGTVAGADLLRELPPDAALAVWQVLRTVLLWSAEEAHARARMFDGATMEEWEHKLLVDTFEPAARNPLAVIIGELAHPGDDTAKRISWACLCVADWALARRAVRTGLAYTEAAALASHGQPRYAWLAGRLLRAHGKLKESGEWLQRAVHVAGREGDWEAHTLGLNSLGNAAYERGNYRDAVHKLNSALRSARRHNLPERQGEILHDLFVVHYAQDDLVHADEFALAAFEEYANGHPRLPALAHDVAFLWMARGYFAQALPILRVLVPHFAQPEDKLRIVASAARAAGACDEAPLFESLWTDALRLTDEAPTGAGLSSALVEVGLGASNLGQWERALTMLDRAVEIAVARGEADVLARAEMARSAARSRRTADTRRMAAGKPSRKDTLVQRVAAILETEVVVE